LIEGTISGDSGFTGKSRNRQYSFVLKSWRCWRDGEKLRKRIIRIRIVVCDARVIERAVRCAHIGRGVRVVGCIAEDKDGLYVEAEHIEYRPGVGGREEVLL
jgi:hypothetical protein